MTRRISGRLRTTLTTDTWTDVECVVHYTYTPGSPGCMYLRNGDPGNPPEPSEVDFVDLKVNKSDFPDFNKRLELESHLLDWITEHESEYIRLKEEIETQLSERNEPDDT